MRGPPKSHWGVHCTAQMENDDGQRNKGSAAAAANTHIRFVLQSANRNEINERKSKRDEKGSVPPIVTILIQPGILPDS